MTHLVFEPSATTHWKNLFPNKTLLLGSHNLNEDEELIAEIVEVSLQKIKNTAGKEEEVPVMTFTNAPPMVLNITNSKTIASLYGDLYVGWKGKSIQLYVTEVKAFGEVTKALRVRQAIPNTGEDIKEYEQALYACKSIEELKQVFTSIPKHLKPRLEAAKNSMKEQLNV